MRIKLAWNFCLTVLSFILLTFTFFAYVLSEKQIDKANDLRYQSVIMALRLHQMSYDLSRLAQTYIITSNKFYKENYFEILGVREGLKPMPDCLLYWELITLNNPRPCDLTRPISLIDKFKALQFTDVEIEEYKKASILLNNVIEIDKRAISLVDTYPNDRGIQFESIRMLHDEAYESLRNSVSEPIHEFLNTVENRTSQQVKSNIHVASTMRVILMSISVLYLLVLGRTYRLSKCLLGADIDAVYKFLNLLDAKTLRPIKIKTRSNSILRKLLNMYNKLYETNLERENALKSNTRLNQLYSSLTECNQSLIRCQTDRQLFDEITKNLVTYGGFQLAWIAKIEDKELKPMSVYGVGQEYLEDITISLNEDDITSKGVTGTSVREDRNIWCQDFCNDPITKPWHERGKKYGWKSSCGLPIHLNGSVSHVLTLYSNVVNGFDCYSQELLTVMVSNMDHALLNFERREALHESRNLLAHILDNVPIRVYWKNLNSVYMGCNKKFAQDALFESTDDVIGKTDFDLCWSEYAHYFRFDDKNVIATQESRIGFEEKSIDCNGNVVWLKTSKVPLKLENDIIGVLGTYEDITQQRSNTEQIYKLANFDTLTGLPNRSQLNERLTYAITLSERSGSTLCLMFLDIDHFKDINDSLGHAVGDLFLIQVADRFKLALRSEDTVTRLGGDEFIFLFPNLDSNGASIVAQKLLDTVSLPFKILEYVLNITASVGIAFYPNDGMDLENLSKNADNAMYKAKQNGRQGFCFFTPEMQAESVRNLCIVSALRKALELNQFELYYQPQCDIKTGRVIGVEALLRWNHPEMGIVSPSEFIKNAENSGLILAIGDWILIEAIKTVKEWHSKGIYISVSINLSALQFKNLSLNLKILSLLAEYDLDHKYIILELTESMAMSNPEVTINTLNLMHKQGIRLAIDDFGTGHSCLAYLKKFKVSKLKIDQSFVREICDNREDYAIVQCVIGLCKSLGISTIAEGVETSDQLSLLCKIGCDEIQGYLFCKPLPLSKDLDKFLREIRVCASCSSIDCERT